MIYFTNPLHIFSLKGYRSLQGEREWCVFASTSPFPKRNARLRRASRFLVCRLNDSFHPHVIFPLGSCATVGQINRNHISTVIQWPLGRVVSCGDRSMISGIMSADGVSRIGSCPTATPEDLLDANRPLLRLCCLINIIHQKCTPSWRLSVGLLCVFYTPHQTDTVNLA